MKNKLCLYLLFSFLFVKSIAQNKQVAYGFDELPQTLMLNPGAEVGYDKHIGIPFLSNFYLQIGASSKNVTYNNVIANSDNFNDLLRNVYDLDLGSDDYFLINQQFEFLNIGLRLKNPDYYLSFGMYQEMDGFSTYPQELAQLYFEGDDKNGDGIPEENVPTNFNEVNFIGDVTGVFHIGISKKVNDKLSLGARLKLISGSLNVQSKNNDGKYSLSSTNSAFEHNFENMNVIFNSSGFIDGDGKRLSSGLSQQFVGLFFGSGNYGLGLDLGLTYHFTEKLTFTASLLNLDYINYSNEVTTYTLEEDFVLPDTSYFSPTPGDELNYWEDKIGDYYNDGLIPVDTLQIGYKSYRSPILNTSISYSLDGKQGGSKSAFRNVSCDTNSSQRGKLSSEVGVQTYTAFRPETTIWAITAFYTREIIRNWNTKITYTYDKFSSKNIGLGVSVHLQNFNFYASADNLLNLPKLKDSNYQSFQFGMNFIFDEF